MSLLRPNRRVGAEERLDTHGHDIHSLDHSLGHVAAVNRWLGGWRSVLLHLPPFLPSSGSARILDLGAGSGEGSMVIARWARKRGRSVQVVAADNHPQMVEIARRRTAAYPEIRVDAADALQLHYPDGVFDAAILTLTLHHFEGDAAPQVLRELARVARGIVVSDLDRTWANYLGAKLLAWTIWAGNPITRGDGPLSVLRSYSADEMQRLARAAGLEHPHVYRHPFQRLVLVAPNPGS